MEITNIITNHLNDLDSRNIQCSWKFEEQGLTKQGTGITIAKDIPLVSNKEKICGNSKVKLEERKLALHCSSANSTHTKTNEGKNTQQLCFTSRIDFYGTTGKNAY